MYELAQVVSPRHRASSPPPPVYRHGYMVVPARAEHVARLATRLRAQDLEEIISTGNAPQRSLWRGYRNSILCETALIDTEVAAMWGLCVGAIVGLSPLSDMGRPWLLTSDLVERVPFGVVREARRAVARMLELTPRLENYVLASYTRAVRMLRLIGFTLDVPVAVGINGAVYSRFHMER